MSSRSFSLSKRAHVVAAVCQTFNAQIYERASWTGSYKGEHLDIISGQLRPDIADLLAYILNHALSVSFRSCNSFMLPHIRTCATLHWNWIRHASEHRPTVITSALKFLAQRIFISDCCAQRSLALSVGVIGCMPIFEIGLVNTTNIGDVERRLATAAWPDPEQPVCFLRCRVVPFAGLQGEKIFPLWLNGMPLAYTPSLVLPAACAGLPLEMTQFKIKVTWESDLLSLVIADSTLATFDIGAVPMGDKDNINLGIVTTRGQQYNRIVFEPLPCTFNSITL